MISFIFLLSCSVCTMEVGLHIHTLIARSETIAILSMNGSSANLKSEEDSDWLDFLNQQPDNGSGMSTSRGLAQNGR
ncbi:hypothetical protein CPB83DRAFT_423913 [Crepidotus variabilis]|uniref:Secreted protein n=1 Tax=Crepidotus variabilis TaxID=179855 RepID=A0A9P6JNA3_9AGAR|nr:hypothetical protein CPB83DRAFT_423913 [Crepidotus variabilis]